MGSNRKVWWVCEKGHEWQATVRSRVSGAGCPVCSNRKILPGYNDLATLHPELVKQWEFAKNGDLKPDQIGCGYDRKVWWICSEGHIWRAAVANRALPGYKHTGCPVCAGRTSIKNKQEYYHMIEKTQVWQERTREKEKKTMKKLRRRAISLILSVVMILSMMPAISWATVTEPDETEWIQGIIA